MRTLFLLISFFICLSGTAQLTAPADSLHSAKGKKQLFQLKERLHKVSGSLNDPKTGRQEASAPYKAAEYLGELAGAASFAAAGTALTLGGLSSVSGKRIGGMDLQLLRGASFEIGTVLTISPGLPESNRLKHKKRMAFLYNESYN